jgi:hypothetical protein
VRCDGVVSGRAQAGHGEVETQSNRPGTEYANSCIFSPDFLWEFLTSMSRNQPPLVAVDHYCVQYLYFHCVADLAVIERMYYGYAAYGLWIARFCSIRPEEPQVSDLCRCLHGVRRKMLEALET